MAERAPFTLAVVGAGPRGVGVLERLGANSGLLRGRRLEVHLIDPFPPGPGRVWRYDQSPLLRMNSMPEDGEDGGPGAAGADAARVGATGA